VGGWQHRIEGTQSVRDGHVDFSNAARVVDVGWPRRGNKEADSLSIMRLACSKVLSPVRTKDDKARRHKGKAGIFGEEVMCRPGGRMKARRGRTLKAD